MRLQTINGEVEGDTWQEAFTAARPDEDPNFTLDILCQEALKAYSVDIYFGVEPDDCDPLQLVHRLHELTIINIVPDNSPTPSDSA